MSTKNTGIWAIYEQVDVTDHADEEEGFVEFPAWRQVDTGETKLTDKKSCLKWLKENEEGDGPFKIVRDLGNVSLATETKRVFA